MGADTNIQDGAILHEETVVGRGCTIGHGAIVHGCTVGDNTLIGMGAIVLNGAKIGSDCIVGAGALVTGKMDAPDGSMILGSPAKVLRPLKPEEIEGNRAAMEEYLEAAAQYRKEQEPVETGPPGRKESLPFMEWNKQKIKGLLLVVCGGVAFYCALQRLDAVLAALGWLLGILAPFLLGGALAFILNVPMRAIERHLFPRNRKGAKLRRPLALVLTLVAVIGVLALAGLVIGPGIADAVMSIIREIPAAFQRLEHQLTALAENLQDLWPLLEEQLMKLQEEIQWQELSAKALEIAKAIGAGIVSSGGFIGGVVSGVSTFVISLIFSFYVLLQKEKLGRQGRQVIYGLLPLAGRPTGRWTSCGCPGGPSPASSPGQCLEACILGTLFVAAMTIFRMPYALLVGVLIALTALIPIVGAFIGCAVGALLIAIDDPWKALWFIVLFLVLQQIEGNLIYPHVVGSSVGLPSIWVLAAVTLGGKLMGITGMLFFIPLCSVIYALFRSYVKNRLVSKAVPPEKWRDPPPPPSRQ